MVIDISKRQFFAKRAAFLFLVKFICITGLGIRLFYLQIMSSKEGERMAYFNRSRFNFVPALRGLIYDRNNVVLASNIENQIAVFTLLPVKRVHLKEIELFYQILYNNDQIKIRQAMNYVQKFIKNNMHNTLILSKSMTKKEIALINFYLPSLENVIIQNSIRRDYTLKDSLAHPIGYVTTPSEKTLSLMQNPFMRRLYQSPEFKIGATGLEKRYNDWLIGRSGIIMNEIDARGNIKGRKIAKDSIQGNDIKLSLDANIQKYAAELFKEGGHIGSIVLIEVETGDVLSIYSSPSYDPLVFNNGKDEDIRNVINDPDNIMFDRALRSNFSPGSTFKPFTLLTALANGWNPNKIINCTGVYKYGGRKWNCWKEGGHGKVDAHRALSQSCNVYLYNIAAEMGIDDLHDCANEFGFGESFDFGYNHCTSGTLPSQAWKKEKMNQAWFGGETLNTSIGQGYLQSNTGQLAVAIARLASNGLCINPRFITEFIEKNDLHKEREALIGLVNNENMINRQYYTHIDYIKQCMHDAVNANFGIINRMRSLSNYEFAGKTGTTQTVSRRISADDMKRSKDKSVISHGLFTGFMPSDKPKVAVACMVEHSVWGASVAAPTGIKLMDFACKKLDV